MNMRTGLILVVMAWLTVFAQAEFVAPDAQQLEQAAQDPNTIGDLLKDATESQAASVMADVISRIASMDLSATQRDARISALVKAAFAAWSGSSTALASALGQVMATSEGSVSTPAVISAVQQSLLSMDTGSGGGTESAFSTAFQASLPTPPATGKGSDSKSTAPPVATLYEGQSLE